MYSTRSDGSKAGRVRHSRWLRYALVAVFLAMGAAQACAQCLEQQKLTASDAGAPDAFGISVSVSGDTAVVGASGDDCGGGILGNACGAAYVYRFNGTSWVEEQKLTASDRLMLDRFGSSVSVNGTTALVGAPMEGCTDERDSHCGSVYVFRFNGTSWVEEQQLTASDRAEGDEFGHSVSLNGDTAFVGAREDDCSSGQNCGSVYVFRFNGASWVEEQKLTASDGRPGDAFGDSVSLSGGTALVGASRTICDVELARCGAAYVFRFNGSSWIEERKLTAADTAVVDNFGSSVSMSGETALVGAPGNDCAPPILDCGSAYVFRFNGTSWVEEQKLTASVAVTGDEVGRSVSLSGDTAVVGAFGGASCPGGHVCGLAYVFRFNGTAWFEQQKLSASDASSFAFFGFSVSLSGETVFLGAPGDECPAGGGNECGAAYVFDCRPICGNGILEAGEACDGSDDAACPGACQSDCTCGPFCGDGTCGFGEDSCLCSADCGTPPPSETPGSTCRDGSDNDCDGFIDLDDPDCASQPIPTASLWGLIFLTLLLLATGKIVFRKTVSDLKGA